MSEEKKEAEQPAKGEHKPSKGFHWLIGVVVPLIGAFVSGGILTYFLNQYSNRLRTLGYFVNTSSGIFPKPDVQGATIKILFGDKAIENLSTVNVQVLNTTDQD